MTIRVGINGFGRIGRNILRAIAESGRKDIEVVGINDLGPVETNAHLLRFDSVHGRFPGTVTVKGDTISVGNGAMKVTAIKDPATLPWKDLGIDIALECTGIFTSKDKASAHLTAGAKRVLVSAPADGVDLTVVYGVNHDKLTKDHKVVSNASCTTNCLAPVSRACLCSPLAAVRCPAWISYRACPAVPASRSRSNPIRPVPMPRSRSVQASARPAFFRFRPTPVRRQAAPCSRCLACSLSSSEA